MNGAVHKRSSFVELIWPIILLVIVLTALLVGYCIYFNHSSQWRTRRANKTISRHFDPTLLQDENHYILFVNGTECGCNFDSPEQFKKFIYFRQYQKNFDIILYGDIVTEFSDVDGALYIELLADFK